MPRPAPKPSQTKGLGSGGPALQKLGQHEVRGAFQALREAHPDAHCELDHNSAFELIVATILSAQTTDVAVNKVTPKLFVRYPSAHKLAEAKLEDVEALLGTLGMFRQKAKNIVKMAGQLVLSHSGQVPESLAALIELAGVGRKTANVVLGVAFKKPEGVVVDTHVSRLSQRLCWTEQAEPGRIEEDLMRLFPRTEWDILSHTLIFHGRRVCRASHPLCSTCPVRVHCPSAFDAENVGRKKPRERYSGAHLK